MVMTLTVSTFAKAVLNIFNQYLFFAPLLPGNPQFFPILGFTGTLNCAGFLHFSFNFFFYFDLQRNASCPICRHDMKPS